MDFVELNNTNDENKIIEYLQHKKVLNNHFSCEKQHKMKLYSRKARKKTLIFWRCTKCNKSTSTKKGSIFEELKLSLPMNQSIFVNVYALSFLSIMTEIMFD